MGKSEFEVSQELKPLRKMFDHFIYKHEISQVLIDFLIMVISQMGTGWEEDHKQAMSRYDDKDKEVLNSMFYEYVNLMNRLLYNEADPDGMGAKNWYDPIGHIYESIAYSGKRSGFGQFFTPDHMCDLLAMINGAHDLDPDKEVRVSDPACGSGRLLLAFKARHTRTKTYAVDKDYVCCLIATLNLAVHGCKGEVICMDTLMPDWDAAIGYNINQHPYHDLSGVPTVFKIDDIRDSVTYANYEAMMNRSVPDKPAAEQVSKPADQPVKEYFKQLSLF